MDKQYIGRLMLAMAICLGLVLLWQHVKYRWVERPQPAPTEAPGVPTGTAQQPAPTETPPTAPSAPASVFSVALPRESYEAAPVRLGDSSYLGPYAMAVGLTPTGGGIQKLVLSDYFASAEDRHQAPNERQKLQLVQVDGKPAFVVTRIEALELDNQTRHAIEKVQQARTGSDETVEHSLGEARWTLEGEPTEKEARFVLPISRDGKPFVTLRKRYQVNRREAASWEARFGDGSPFDIHMELSAEDHTGELLSVTFTLRGPEGLAREDTRTEDRVAIGGFANPERNTELKSGGQAEKEKDRTFSPELDWAGMINKYFAFVAVADPKDAMSRFESAHAYPAYREAKGVIPGVMMTTYQKKFNEATRVATAQYTLFAGPKDKELLEKPVHQERGLVQLVQWTAGCCCIPGLQGIPGVKELAQVMVWAIDQIARVVQNKGVAVIILVLLTRLLLLPISRYSTMSMLKMQDLQPQLAKMKEEFKDDTQRQQVEQMRIMREQGVNPLMGCLPMMLQMPIWIALYTGINVSISLRQAPFFLWIDDLSKPDALLAIPKVTTWGLSFIGDWAGWQLNVLPILMFVAFFLQMKFQPQAAGSSPEMERQQKMMKYMMPVMMIFFFYPAPSALNLYIMASSFVGYAEQRYTKWHHAKMKSRPPKPKKPRGAIGRWIDGKLERLHKLQERAQRSEGTWDRSKKRPGKD